MLFAVSCLALVACRDGTAGGASTPPPTAVAGTFDRTIDLADGPALRLVLQDVYDPAVPGTATTRTSERLVAARLAFTNLGDNPAPVMLAAAMQALDEEGATYRASAAAVEGCPPPGATDVVQSGDTRTGCAVFSIPTGRALAALRFTDPGAPSSSVEWRL